MKLTKRTIDAAKPTCGRYVLWDSELPGFGLRISPASTKTFIVRYRPHGGRNAPRRFVTVGRYGVLTPDQARDRARDILAEVALGKDPATARDLKRDELTIR